MFLVPCLAQSKKATKHKLNKSKVEKRTSIPPLSEEGKQQQAELKRMDEEVSYYASIRYVIVYNEIWKRERRIEVLMEAKKFNEDNLIKIFELIKKRFPEPQPLMITVHTSLATIETPEENEMMRRSDDPRFAHTHFKFKKAHYFRFENGREAFNYPISLSPYKDKSVVLKKGKV